MGGLEERWVKGIQRSVRAGDPHGDGLPADPCAVAGLDPLGVARRAVEPNGQDRARHLKNHEV